MKIIAPNGLYKQGDHVIIVCNDSIILDDKSVRKGPYSQLMFDDKTQELFFENIYDHMKSSFGGNSNSLNSRIESYVRLIDKDTLLNGMDLLYDDYYKENSDVVWNKASQCATNISALLNGNIQSLPEFENFQMFKNNKKNKIFNKSQYVDMSVYLAAAKNYGEEYYQKFVQNPYVRSVLFNMSFDYTGICTKMEEKLAENMNSRKK